VDDSLGIDLVNDELEVWGGVTYGNVTEDGQQDVDEEVGIASALKEHTERREEDGEHDLDKVAGMNVSKAQEQRTALEASVCAAYTRTWR
jgi:hypothetical protein